MRFEITAPLPIASLFIALLVIVGCESPIESDRTTAAPVTVDTASPLIASLPANSCLTVKQCGTVWPCERGDRLVFSPGPISNAGEHVRYGSIDCPYFVRDLLNPAVLPPGSATLVVGAAGDWPYECPGSSLGVYVYGHSAAGWTALPALTTVEPPTVSSVCSFLPISTPLGGLGQYDQVRILTGGDTTTGGKVPVLDRIDGCVPSTCADLGRTCGKFSNGCGGTVNCGTCAPSCGPKPVPPPGCHVPLTCCGTDAWVCGRCW